MTISFTPPPTLPSLNDPANFNSRALALFSWLTGTHINEQQSLDASDFFSVLGTVSQSAGVPTGALIERGSNANGEYVRLADGTQICTVNALSDTASNTSEIACNGTYPALFASGTDVVFAASILDQRSDASITFDTDMTAKTTVISRYLPDHSPNSYSLRLRSPSGTYVTGTSKTRVLAVFHGRWF